MEKTILEKYITQGVFAVLFIWLLFTVMNTSAERETKLQAIIEKQNETLAKFSDIIKVDLNEVKGKLK